MGSMVGISSSALAVVLITNSAMMAVMILFISILLLFSVYPGKVTEKRAKNKKIFFFFDFVTP